MTSLVYSHCRATRSAFLFTTALAGLIAGATPAFAQDVAAAPAAPQSAQGGSGNVPDDATTEEIVVTGVRASLSSAQSIKQNADQIVDSIVAEDIGKLPDRNVAEALQRITGIQIQRNFGEGSQVAIRGLSQVRTEINGRDIFTANSGRTLSLEDVPSELLAGVDVYKNPSAELIEGGLGGLINLRTRKPFDFDGFKFSASGSLNHYDLYETTKPQANLLVSNRWDTGIGEIGLLVDLAYQETAFRQDQISSQPFFLLNEAVAADAATAAGLGRTGQPTYLPHGVGIGQYLGDRRRIGVDVALQWRPSDTLEFTAEYIRSDYKFRYGDYSFFAYTGDGPITPDFSQPFTFDEDGNFTSGTFVNVPIDSNTSLERRKSVTSDYSLNAKWTPTENFTLKGDFQYIRGTTDGERSIVILHSNAERLFQEVGNGVPSMIISPDANPANGNGNLLDPASYATNPGGYLDHIERAVGTEYAGRIDAEYRFDDSFLRSIAAGVRYTDRSAVTDSSTYAFYGLTGALADDLYQTRVFRGNLYRGDASVPEGALFFNRGIVLDYDATRAALAPYAADSQRQALLDGVAYVPSDRNTQGEKTYTGYAVARFGIDSGFRVDGNIGVRVIKTEVSTDGFSVQTPQIRVGTDVNGNPIFGNGPISYVPISADSSYTKVLPSLNLRFHLMDGLQLRLAASKGLTRPDFNQLNPNINIVEFNSGGNRRTASSGNANLRPLEADQLDASLEWYFSKTGSIYGAAFYKKVDGFIANVTSTETFDFGNGNGPFVVDVTRPLNGDNGKIKGFEVGGNAFFDFLPGIWSGFGVQANYTYVDSKAPSPDAQDTSGNQLSVPLEKLSKHSYNLIGFYDRGPISARVAYNWRSSFVVTTRGNGSGNLPIFNAARGQLDASFTYTFTPNFALTVDGVNLTDTENKTYYGIPSRPQSHVLNDRRLSITARITY